MSRTRRLTEVLVLLATREVADAGPIPGFDHFNEADYDEHLDTFLHDRPDGTKLTSRSRFPSVEALEGALATGMTGGAIESWDRLAEAIASI